MIIKLSDLNPNIFRMSGDETSVARGNLIACGRLLAVERAGRGVNALRAAEGKKGGEYVCKLSEEQYAVTNKNFKERLMLFAAEVSARSNGENAPATYEEFYKAQRKYLSDATFLKVLAGIFRDILPPTAPAVMSNALSWLCQSVSTPIGTTYEIDVGSNDIFLFQDDSWGASRSKPANHNYTKTITLNPTPRTARASVKWYQMVGNNADLGALMNSVNAGMANKIVALWNGAMVKAQSNGMIPSGATFTTFTSANWVKAVKAVHKMSSFRDVIAFGDLEALMKVLPAGNSNGASINLDAALTELLGAEWARYGYIGEYLGARLMPLDNVVVPGTQNTTVTDLLPNNVIWFAGAGSKRPVYLCFEDGTPITLDIAPSDTGDMTLDLTVTVSLAAAPVFADKLAVMTGV